jgi:predicted nucleotidyltransferase
MGDSFESLVARAEADLDVVGVVLTGSRARGMATEHSDTDVLVVVRERGGAWLATTRTPELDTIVVTLSELADVSDRWQRYAYRGAHVLVDRLDGGISELVNTQATLTRAESDAWVRTDLDGYVNFCYRAAKSRRDGRHDLARLEEMEAGPWFLWTLFALYGRVRPYNKYLRWELETHPLPAPWSVDRLIATVLDRASRLFDDLEATVRAMGFADVLDAWDELYLIRAPVGYAADDPRRTNGRDH